MPDIRLKRSSGSTPPISLGSGELAWVDGTNTLFIGKIDGTVTPIAGSGVALLPSIVCTASEAIAAGSLINFHGNGLIRLANAAIGFPADGFVKIAIASGSIGNAYTLVGSIFSPLVEGDIALIGGNNYFLSAAAPGRITINTVNAGGGYLHQKIGKLAGNLFLFCPSEPILRS